MKFTAKPTDLKLELVTFEGKEIVRECPNKQITAEQATLIMKKLGEKDAEIRSLEATGDLEKVGLLVAEQLEAIYEGEPKWWISNFDFGTLVEIKMWTIGQLSGIRKNVRS